MRTLALKVYIKFINIFENFISFQKDRFFSTYCLLVKTELSINTRLEELDISSFKEYLDLYQSASRKYIDHKFNLLGSGWQRVCYGMTCPGMEGNNYANNDPVYIFNNDKWLKNIIANPNLSESKKIWEEVCDNYVPINWNIDFKSGYIWDYKTWFKNIKYGDAQGVDIKVPWELARLQHLPQLAITYGLQKQQGVIGGGAKYVIEFRDQCLDFIASNPPRYGVNWVCSMDVGIRAVNMLLALDIFCVFGESFDKKFNAILARSIYEHGEHIINNLEWYPQLRSNHYLANIVGLLFISVYLPRNKKTNAWLAFSVYEFINAVNEQFYEDGANFEASTSYHRLSAEMVVFAAALILGFDKTELEALHSYDSSVFNKIVHFKPKEITLYEIEGVSDKTPLPPSLLSRINSMANFTIAVTAPNGKVVQIGDNDSGRLVKLTPSYSIAMMDDDLENEEILDHGHLVNSIHAIFGSIAKRSSKYQQSLEEVIIKDLIGSNVVSGNLGVDRSNAKQKNLKDQFIKFKEFGLYVYRSEDLFLTFRCGSVGQNGNGGHAHNDQLSIELHYKSLPVLVDYGTYIYTALPELRNKFRSTGFHNTLYVKGIEQNSIEEGLFVMPDRSHAKIEQIGTNQIIGSYAGYKYKHRREITIYKTGIAGIDLCDWRGEKIINFCLIPGAIAAIISPTKIKIIIEHLVIFLEHDSGVAAIENAFYSPSYGVKKESSIINIYTASDQIKWKVYE